MKVIYIAGPFRAASAYIAGEQDAWQVQQHVMQAMALGLEVWRLGAVALIPHANSMFFQGAAPDHVWLEGDLALLRRCDAVLLTPDWEASRGATAEAAQAREWAIPVFTTLADLHAWLSRDSAGKA